jgi:predicted N-formylglutamate amidohydrolase
MDLLPVYRAFAAAARQFSSRSVFTIDKYGTIIFNPLAEQSPSALVFTAPHIGNKGLKSLGLLDGTGRLKFDIPWHRATDVNLDRFVRVFSALSGHTIVGTTYSRLFFNAAVPQGLAVAQHTPDGVPIPAYQGRFFNHLKKAILRFFYHPHIRARNEQFAYGKEIGSLDTFTPDRLEKIDIGKRRDMLVSIIARTEDENSVFVLRLQAELSERLKQYLPMISSVIGKQSGDKYPINPNEPVTINKPYGVQMHSRLDALQRGGITIEIRSDALNDPALVFLIARTLHRSVEIAHAAALKADNGNALRNGDMMRRQPKRAIGGAQPG